MTLPSRPAPAPPKQGGNPSNGYGSMAQWKPFQMQSTTNNKKAPPPRPPPPKVITNSNSNVTQPRPPAKQSVNILSNLFAKKGNNNKTVNETTNLKKSSEQKIPPKIPAPPCSLLLHQTLQPRQTSDVQLISFDSPSISPTMTQVSSSDCVSVDSFSSDSNYSPHNGGMSSQAESGFEDDFSVADLKIQPISNFSKKPSVNLLEDPFDMDPFSAPQQTNQIPSNIRNVRQVTQQKPLNVGNASFYASTSSFASSSSSSLSALASTPAQADSTLCNGKNLLPTPSPVMPTIIKPPGVKSKTSSSPTLFSAHKKPAPQAPIIPTENQFDVNFNSDESFDEDTSLPSPPMPSIPPPPLPQEFFSDNTSLEILESVKEEEEKESYGIALYDFESEHIEDLNFKVRIFLHPIQFRDFN